MPSTQTPLTPEEDATLQAIESLEARSDDTFDENPAVIAKPKPAVTVAPIITPPVTIAVPPPRPKPIVAVTPPQPTTPPISDIAAAIAAALASVPALSKQPLFKPFAKQIISKKPFIIIGIVTLIVGIGVGAYFVVIKL